MFRRLVVGIGLLLLLAILASAAILLWLRSDALRLAVVTQATATFGMPVRIDSARATVFPRLGIELLNVTVGDPPRASVDRASIATGFSLIWSRRLESADIQLTGGYLETSLLSALAGGAASLSATSSVPTEGQVSPSIVSIRSIRLRGMTLIAGGVRIPVSLDALVADDRLTLTTAAASVSDATLHIVGELSSLARREGHFDVQADVLPVADLVAVLTNLTPAGTGDSAASQQAPPAPFRLTASISAPAALLGTSRAEPFEARLEATPTGIVLDPVTFGLDDGRFEMRVSFDVFDPDAPLHVRGRVSGLDVARLQSSPGEPRAALTGRLDATFAIEAPQRADLAAMRDDGRGSIDLVIGNGRMPGIQIVRQAVIRFADRAGPTPRMDATDGFSRLDASLTLQPGVARITRLTMQAADFDVAGDGALSPVDWRLALAVNVTLTEALSQQAGRDLYRYAHDGRRIVLPAVIGGTLFEPTASIDVGKAAGRALKNRLEDEVRSLLDRVIKKRPPE